MATWAEFEAAMPEMAGKGRSLVYQFGPGLGFLATVRNDGGPRLHPMCPLIVDGGLWALIGPHGPKCADLRRDGRYALHAFTPEDVDDEFLVTGRATERSGDAGAREAVVAAAHWPVAPDEVLFSLDIERAMLAVYKARGDWPPAYTVWHAPSAG
jgi:Pyridoxamine 5'-phosphate oxidase